MKNARSPKACARKRTAWMRLFCAGLIYACLSLASEAQQTPAQPARPSVPQTKSKTLTAQATHITPEQAKQLFNSVDSILQFDSEDTGLPILRQVKRRLVTRDEVEQYLVQQLRDDRDAKRLQRSELVLKKFGLLDRDFDLQPFLIRLLREQIAGYYDDKTKTVNLLDWIPPEEQKPVLAHELTHALQDQHVDLQKWDAEDDLSIAKNAEQDNRHIASDEEDAARNAVIEGQAMAVFIDYALAPYGKNLLSAPQVADKMEQAMNDPADSPTLASAPLVLQRSLLFPYVYGLTFVRAVLAAQGKQAAYAGMLDHPPSSTYEIMTPEVYLDHVPVPLLHMPDIHPLIEAQYRPYDVGVMGEFDVQIMTELFGGEAAAKALTPAWRGGIYYAAQSKAAKTDAAQNSSGSLALFYLSQWASPQAAQGFADIYAREIPRKYDGAIRQPDSEAGADTSISTRTWNTPDGPVLITVSGPTVFISESFPPELARKLQLVMLTSLSSSGSILAQSDEPRIDLAACLRRWLSVVGELRASLAMTGAPSRIKKGIRGRIAGSPVPKIGR